MNDERLSGYTRIPKDCDIPRSHTIDQSTQFSWLLDNFPDDGRMYYATNSNGIKESSLPAKKLAPWFDETRWSEVAFGIVSPIIAGDIRHARAHTQAMATAKNLAELLAGMSESREMKGFVTITRDMVVSSPNYYMLKPRVDRADEDFINMRQLVRFAGKVTVVQTMAAGLISDIDNLPLVVSQTTELSLALKPASEIPDKLVFLENEFDRKSCGSIDYAGLTGQVFLANVFIATQNSKFLRGIPPLDIVEGLRKDIILSYYKNNGRGNVQLYSEMMALGSLLQVKGRWNY